MKVKGSAVVTLPLFIKEKFGENEFKKWLNSLSPDTKKEFEKNILINKWYPLKETLSDPTEKLCDLFFDGDSKGAWEIGRFSADYALKGIYKLFIRVASPYTLAKKASHILPTYYDPSDIETEIKDKSENKIILRITKFPEMTKAVENRILGWIERALEICGCKNIKFKETKSLLKGDNMTELSVTWN